jgi:acid stress-induced BolA-like protein IbaG/YrbA
MDAKSQEQVIEEALSTQLGLRDPEFHLEILPSGSVSGSIVSDTFAGMDDLERQHRIWDVLDNIYGPASTKMVGTLLAYSKKEWNWDEGAASAD